MLEDAPGRIPEAQWGMPVSFLLDGSRMVTLQEYKQQPSSILALPELTPEQCVELVAARISLQPSFKLAILGTGTIDQTRAIAEVQANSQLGRNLIEIEQILIGDLLQEVLCGN